MRADTRNASLIQYNDLLRMHDGRDALRDQQHCAAVFPAQFVQRPPQRRIGLEVQRGEAVVKQVDFGRWCRPERSAKPFSPAGIQ